MKTYKICPISLGCAKNQYDMEAALAEILTEGHEIVYDYEDADIIIINTCSFIESAREETKANIEEAVKTKKHNPKIKIIVSGCYPQKFNDELISLYGKYITAYCGIEMHKYIMDIIHNIKSYKSQIEATATTWTEPLCGRLNTLGDYVGNIKISEGCNNCCSYCAIPSIRGVLRSRPEEYILKEAQIMSDNGIKELNIIAQDITAYGKDLGKPDALPELLYKLNDIKGALEWIRLLYAYPTEITSALIKAIKDCDKVVKYLDIPLQHGDNKVLKDMNRRGTSEEYLETIGKLRVACPNICLRSTFIVGYPTESEKAFKNLIEFVKLAEFDRAGFFTYSREINTPAYNITEYVPDEVIEERAKILAQTLENISLKKNKSLIGKNLKMLCEYKEGNFIYGRTERDAIDIDGIIKIKAEIPSPRHFLRKCHPPQSKIVGGQKELLGNIITVQVTEADAYDLEGKLI